MPTTEAPLIELVDVTRRFPGVLALDGVSLSLLPGEVHALVGENGAGKSTLINILSGVLPADSGRLLLRGQQVSWSGPVAARRHGIVCVHQEAESFATLSVAENMALEQGLPTGFGGWVHWSEIYRQARQAMALVDEGLDVRQSAARLGVARRHMMQIAAAVCQQAQVLILDEPTSALAAAEVDWLFRQIEALKRAGVGILYISHRQEEIFRLADRITVLRDGRCVWSGARNQIDREGLVRYMVGRASSGPVVESSRVVSASHGPARLEVNALTTSDGRCRDVSFAAHAGEILGMYGLIGSGRTETAQAFFGLTKIAAGSIKIDGREVTIATPAQAATAGLAYLPEDRLRQGVFHRLSVRANTVLSSLASLNHRGFASGRLERQATEQQVSALAVRCRDIEQPIAQLSGGNQQKVVLGRWLLTQPKVLILDEPTRGVDVGAKAEIHRLLRKLAGEGAAVILISSDLPEILENADRVLVFRAGRVAQSFAVGQATAENVGGAAIQESGEQSKTEHASPVHRTAWSLRSEWILAAAVMLLLLALAATNGRFLTGENLLGLLSSASVITILALGAAFVILAGGIDISLGALLALATGAGGLVLKLPYPPGVTVPASIAITLAVGAAGGLCNAGLALAGRVHPIVVTLGTMTIYRGLLITLTGGDTITDLPGGFIAWSTARWGPLNGSVALAAIVVAGAVIYLNHLRAGRHLIAFGASPAAARLVGISKTSSWLKAFGAGGLLAGLAGLLELSQTGALQSGMGTGYELQAIAAAVIGGVSISGGRGSVVGVCLGALLLSLIYNAVVLWQISRFHYSLVTGLLLLTAVLADLAWRRLER